MYMFERGDRRRLERMHGSNLHTSRRSNIAISIRSSIDTFLSRVKGSLSARIGAACGIAQSRIQIGIGPVITILSRRSGTVTVFVCCTIC